MSIDTTSLIYLSLKKMDWLVLDLNLKEKGDITLYANVPCRKLKLTSLSTLQGPIVLRGNGKGIISRELSTDSYSMSSKLGTIKNYAAWCREFFFNQIN